LKNSVCVKGVLDRMKNFIFETAFLPDQTAFFPDQTALFSDRPKTTVFKVVQHPS